MSTYALAIPDPSRDVIPKGWAERFRAEHLSHISEVDLLHNGASTLRGYIAAWKGKGYQTKELEAALRYTELRIGELLGPPVVGNPQLTGAMSAAADIGLDKHNRYEFRQMAAHQAVVVQAIQNGARSRGAVLRAIDEYKREERVVETIAPVGPDIRHGDFREVLADVPAESVALVLTDPPYPAEYLPLWSDLAAFAERVLVPGGSLVAYSGQGNLPQVLCRLSEHLRYWWIFALQHRHGSQSLQGKGVTCGWKPLVWFVKGGRRDKRYITDRLDGSQPRKTMGDWAQGWAELIPLIEGLTRDDELIIDPFAGTGTTGEAALALGRRFLGAENGEHAAEVRHGETA